MISRDNIMFVCIIIVIVVLFVLAYRLYRKILSKQENEPVLLRKPLDGRKAVRFDAKYTPISPLGTGYTYMFWINVEDWNYRLNTWKHILHKGDEEGKAPQPSVWLTPKVNNLCVRLLTSNNKGTLKKMKNVIYASMLDKQLAENFYKPTDTGLTLGEIKKLANRKNSKFVVAVPKGKILTNDTVVIGGNIAKTYIKNDELVEKNYAEQRLTHLKNADVYSFEYVNNIDMNPLSNNAIEDDTGMSVYVKNMPLNRWTHVAIVTNEQSVEVFIDGLLYSTTLLANSIKENDGSLYLNQEGGFGGRITQLRYFNRVLDQNEVIGITRRGPDPFMIPGLNVKAKINFNADDVCDALKKKQAEIDELQNSVTGNPSNYNSDGTIR